MSPLTDLIIVKSCPYSKIVDEVALASALAGSSLLGRARVDSPAASMQQAGSLSLIPLLSGKHTHSLSRRYRYSHSLTCSQSTTATRPSPS